MALQVFRTKDGVFTISLDHGDSLIETKDRWQMFRAIAHYFGMEHHTHVCLLCQQIRQPTAPVAVPD